MALTGRRQGFAGLGRSAEAGKTRSGRWLTTTAVMGVVGHSPDAPWPSPPDAADALPLADAVFPAEAAPGPAAPPPAESSDAASTRWLRAARFADAVTGVPAPAAQASSRTQKFCCYSEVNG